MASLEQILLNRDWVARDQLRAALNHQRDLGGTLGTCLLELGAITEERLLKALSEVHGVPYAEVDTLRELPEEVRSLIPDRLARRCKAVPFHRSGTALHVAMLDPGDLACQDEIAFACGKRIHVHVTSEIRLTEALDLHYGHEAPSRMSTLIDKLNRSRYFWKEKAAVLPPGGPDLDSGSLPHLSLPELPDPVAELFPERKARRAAPAAKKPRPRTPIPSQPAPAVKPHRPGSWPAEPPRAPSSIKLSPEEMSRLYPDKAAGRRAEPAPPPPPRAPAEPTDAFAAAEERLAATSDREEVGAILLDLLETLFERVALFVVRGDQVEGWLARGDGLDSERFGQLLIRLDAPSAFLNLKAGSPFHLGPLADVPAHRMLAECWGGGLPLGSLLVPVRIHGRLVLALYGDRVEEPVAGMPLNRFQSLAEQTAIALERCIVLKKKRATDGHPG